MDILQKIANELNLKTNQVNTVLQLFEEGATIPFIARYRKENTGGLDEEQLRDIEERHNYLSLLESRKDTILKSIEEQGKLTSELKNKILSAEKLQEAEDLYLPYKPKRKTRGTVAKAKGLEPLALFILENPRFDGDFESHLMEFVDEDKGVSSAEDALTGAKDIIAEMISETAEVRKIVRDYLRRESLVASKRILLPGESEEDMQNDNYQIYHDFRIDIKRIKPHQVLAINRGEREKFLRVGLSFDKDEIFKLIYNEFIGSDKTVFEDLLKDTTADAFNRLIHPSLEREIRKEITLQADEHAIEVFASNLRQLLLQPPISNIKIMGIDPGFVSGSKVAVIDETGKYLEGRTIYPHPPQKKVREAKRVIADFVNKYNVELIAIGNGTASRETEFLVAELIKEENLNCHYLIVNEAGASVYSASKLAKEEFPELEASMRGNISIARRVLDPLAELVKIDPQSIGVGLYQHDVDQKLLTKKLDDVIVSCVNYVGVELNTASVSLLTHVSGLNKRIAKAIVKYRESIGSFKNRNELMKVQGIGEKAFEQCAGFLKISNGENPLDNTFIHPESYAAAEKLLKLAGVSLMQISDRGSLVELLVKEKGIGKAAEQIGVGIPTLTDILENLKKPGRDPREEMPKPILRSDVLKMEDLSEGMILKGTVRNVVDFGAFVDIGVKQDGLLHISQIADKYIKHPLEALSVGDIIDVKIMSVEIERGRISLSMKKLEL